MKVLVTGVEGFVGHHLVPALLAGGAEVVGTAFAADAAADLTIPVHQLDVTDATAVQAVLSREQPTHIVHLAAVSSVRESFAKPDATGDVNVRGTRALLDAAVNLASAPRVLLIGSSEEYGMNDGLPLTELPVADLHPVSPYGESKKAVEELVEGNDAFRALVIRTRSFAHIGAGQHGKFFIPEVVEQIVAIERGQRAPTLGVGNLNAIRDFTDVQDVVRAYILLLHHGIVGEVYNVCSGTGIRISDLLQQLLSLSSATIRVEQDPAKVRPVDIPVLLGNHDKLTTATEWEPLIPLETTLKEIVAEARGR